MRKLLTDLARVLSMQFVVLLLMLGLVALGYYFRKDILISYHKWGEKSTLKSMWKHGAPADEKFHRYAEKHQKHEKALIELGYLEKRAFDTKYLTINSPQTNKMTVEFMERFPRGSPGIGWGKALSITDLPERMPVWEELVRKYDVPPDDANQLIIQNK